jgi:secretion/DNA translocation related CpaE-like protein
MDPSSPASSPAHVIGVLGLSGGVGASTVATALAVRAAQTGCTVLLVDGHPFGGGLDLLLGDDLIGDLGWPQLCRARGDLDTGAVLRRLPADAGCAVLSWDRSMPPSAKPVQDPHVWCQLAAEVDLTVVDLPGPGRAEARSWLCACTDVLVVVDAGVTGAAAAMVGMAALGLSDHHAAPHVVGALVRARGVPTTEAFARALDIPVLGVLRDDPEVARALTTARPVGAVAGPVRRSADEVLATVLVQQRGAA